MTDESRIPAQRLLTMQIIAAALPLGVIFFFGIVLFIVYGQGGAGPAPQQVLPMVTMVASIMFVTVAPMSFVVPAMVTQAELKKRAAGSADGDFLGLLGLRQTTLIIGLALLEGPAFLGLIAFLLEREPLVLIIPGLALLGMLARFPTMNSVRDWIDVNERRVQELRNDRSM